MGRVNLSGLTRAFIMVNFMITIYMAKVGFAIEKIIF